MKIARIALLITCFLLIVGVGAATRPAALEIDPVQAYMPEKLLELYSLDYTSRTYQQITKSEDIEKVITGLKGYRPSSKVSHDVRQTGFLVFTDRGKYTVYLSSNAKDRETRELYALSQKLNREYPRHVQWLVYMSTDQIESIEFRAFGGKGYTTRKNIHETYYIDALITDRESIEKVSSFLKGMVVNPKEQVHRKPYPNPGAVANEYSLDIHFKNGISYRCYGPFLYISSSDMDEMISYSEPESYNQVDALRDLMLELPESKRKWMEGFTDG